MLEEQRDCEQREAISGFLAAGLRQIFNGQIAPGTTGTLRNLPIPSSLIQIDLASLGINSLNTIMNFLDQNIATTISVLSNTLQSLPSLQPQPVDLCTRSAPITRVYYRRKFKGKAKELEKATISVELSSQHDKNILPASPEEYVPTHSTDIASMDKGKDNVARKKKCCTPVSTQMLRRSPRFIEKLNGCKPTMISSKKTRNRNKTKGKKIKSQTDLLDDILLPSTC